MTIKPSLPAALAALWALDAAPFAPDLSPRNAAACWSIALRGASEADLGRSVPGLPPSVLIVASANVFTAPLEWAWQLGTRGVRVIIKAAREHEAVARAMAEHLPNVEARAWKGGVDLDEEARALDEVGGVVAFGTSETIEALRSRAPGLPFVGFGPKFGVAIVDHLDRFNTAPLARDHALYDGRGCMSPAVVFVRSVDMDALATSLAVCERAVPRGRVTDAEAAMIRARIMGGRAAGVAGLPGPREGEGWAIAHGLPFSEMGPSLPRCVTIRRWERMEEVVALLRPHADQLGTIGTWGKVYADVVQHFDPGRVRICELGKMQRPSANRPHHDGIDVLAALSRVKGDPS